MLTVDYLFLDHECYLPVEPKLYNDREVKEIKYQRNSNSFLKPEVGYSLEEKRNLNSKHYGYLCSF